MQLVFASNNAHKIREIQQLIGERFQLKTLHDIGCFDDIPETQSTIEGNASQKANFVFERYKLNCFADDTGLEIEALSKAPGVLSARYAGEERDNEKNIDKVLKNLLPFQNRNAHFKTIISLILDKQEFLFEGIAEGTIALERTGTNGFGYDSVFIPKGFTQSFAQMTSDEKNKISHRAIAFKKLARYLKSIQQS
ncbi:MAG: non-canonical purine NTP diphosphatase [Bacteroidetes bacterium]|nr:non-canonical purine NTP diphosphatase [Bacteroidota bacterium]